MGTKIKDKKFYTGTQNYLIFQSMSSFKNTSVMVVVLSIRLLLVIELTKANLQESTGRNIRISSLKIRLVSN